MNELEGKRRPLKSRDTQWASRWARRIAATGIRPNQISVASVFFAASAALCLILTPSASQCGKMLLLVAAAAFVQLRLLCNLFDGMVAIEGGFRTKVGELYNELPDRIADTLILVAAGHASESFPFAAVLGWGAAILAILTAYVRALGVVAGAPEQQFCGPMAKPHRMAVITAACLLSVIEVLLNWPMRILPVALAIVVVGTTLTIIRRLRRIACQLESR